MRTQLRFSRVFPQRYRAGSQEAPRRWVPSRSERLLAHAGYKPTAATCFWRLLWKLILLHNIALYLTQVPPEFVIGRLGYFESFPPDWFPFLCQPPLPVKAHLESNFTLQIKKNKTKQNNPKTTQRQKKPNHRYFWDIATWFYTL